MFCSFTFWFSNHKTKKAGISHKAHDEWLCFVFVGDRRRVGEDVCRSSSVYLLQTSIISHVVSIPLCSRRHGRARYFSSAEMSWILSRKNGLTPRWWWSLQMASVFFPFLTLPPPSQIEKNKSITALAAPLTIFPSFPAADLFANMHFPRVTDTQNYLLNGMQNSTFAAFLAGRPTKIWNMPFAFHADPSPHPLGSTPNRPTPLLSTSFHTLSKYQSVWLFFDSIAA